MGKGAGPDRPWPLRLCGPFILTFSSSPASHLSSGERGQTRQKKISFAVNQTGPRAGISCCISPQPTLVHKQPTHQAGVSLPTLLGPEQARPEPRMGPGAWVPPSQGTYFLRFPPNPRPSGEGLRQVRLPGGPAQGHPDTAPGDAQEPRGLQSTRGRALTSLQVAVRSSPLSASAPAPSTHP